MRKVFALLLFPFFITYYIALLASCTSQSDREQLSLSLRTPLAAHLLQIAACVSHSSNMSKIGDTNNTSSNSFPHFSPSYSSSFSSFCLPLLTLLLLRWHLAWQPIWFAFVVQCDAQWQFLIKLFNFFATPPPLRLLQMAAQIMATLQRGEVRPQREVPKLLAKFFAFYWWQADFCFRFRFDERLLSPLPLPANM